MARGKIKVALAQMNIEWENKEVNKKKCLSLVRTAAKHRADLVVFPEMTLTGFSMNVRVVAEDERASSTVHFFSELAKKFKVAILFGVVFKDVKSGRGKNMAIVVDAKGKRICTYQKIHPFTFGGEHKRYIGGNSLCYFAINGVKCSVVVCYDLRFPGLFEAAAKRSPEAVFVIANWPKKREAHWKILLQARSLDMQSYVVGVNRVGYGGELAYNGGSMCAGPNGEVAGLGTKESLAFAEIAAADIRAWRNQFTSLKDKRPHTYI